MTWFVGSGLRRFGSGTSGAGAILSAALGVQIAVILILALAAAIGWGMAHAGHLLFGGLAVWAPNALFALRLALHRDRQAESYPAVFFVGEFAKIRPDRRASGVDGPVCTRPALGGLAGRRDRHGQGALAVRAQGLAPGGVADLVGSQARRLVSCF